LANDASIQERLDSARIAAARSSPMMDCVNFVLQYVDSQALASLASQLIDLIKQPGIALGTKGATVHVITTLTHQCPLDLQQVLDVTYNPSISKARLKTMNNCLGFLSQEFRLNLGKIKLRQNQTATTLGFFKTPCFFSRG
jgi:proteasome component ECM29